MNRTCNGVRLAYQVTGQGSAVTMIHGLSVSGKVWREEIEALSESHKVVAYDLRGHGESAKPADGSFSFASQVRDLVDLLDGLGIQQTALVGWSLGVSIAVAFAALHPERVSKLVLIDGTPMLVAAPDFPYAAPPVQAAALLAAAQHDFGGTMKLLYQIMLPEPHDPALDDVLLGMAHQTGPDVYVAIMQQVAAFDLRPTIAQVTAPTLVLHGELDLLCPLPAGQYIADHIPGARFGVVPGAGHGPFLSRPEVVDPILVRFLA